MLWVRLLAVTSRLRLPLFLGDLLVVQAAGSCSPAGSILAYVGDLLWRPTLAGRTIFGPAGAATGGAVVVNCGRRR